MKDTEFIQKRPDRGGVIQTCGYIEHGAHKLRLMSNRQHMTVTELRAQVAVLQQWLRDLDDQLAQPVSYENNDAPAS